MHLSTSLDVDIAYRAAGSGHAGLGGRYAGAGSVDERDGGVRERGRSVMDTMEER